MQGIVVALAIGAALAYLGWRAWRRIGAARRSAGGGCGPDCGCGED